MKSSIFKTHCLFPFVAMAMGAAIAPSSAVIFGGYNYTLTMGELNWQAAELAAINNGGHLASIHSLEEQEFLWNTFGADEEGNARDLWIGLNDISIEGEYEWTDGSSFDFSLWHAPDEPNNGAGFAAENVVELRAVWDGDWNDADANDLQFGIIKTAIDGSGTPNDTPNDTSNAPVGGAPNSVPDTGGSLILLGTGLAALVAAKRRFSKVG